jgi:hypothetical protein
VVKEGWDVLTRDSGSGHSGRRVEMEPASARSEVIAARDAAIKARGTKEGLVLGDFEVSVELGTLRECWAFDHGAAELLRAANGAYAVGDTATGDLLHANGMTWSAIADMCYRAAGV